MEAFFVFLIGIRSNAMSRKLMRLSEAVHRVRNALRAGRPKMESK